ncbi:MAG: hypothetical protein VW619_00610, partial [Rhodobiaceae bacterium]
MPPVQYNLFNAADVRDLGLTLLAGNRSAQDGQRDETANKAAPIAEISVDSQHRSARAMRRESEKFQCPNRCGMTFHLNITSQVHASLRPSPRMVDGPPAA